MPQLRGKHCTLTLQDNNSNEEVIYIKQAIYISIPIDGDDLT